MQPIEIPLTTPTRYVSFNRALNVRVPQELTGDWHFKVSFFSDPDEDPKVAALAGVGEAVDTTPTLGDHGVRDMAPVLAQKRVITADYPIYFANHFRAIADLAMTDLARGRVPQIATPETVNQWLDTEDQFLTLIEEYLTPLRGQLTGAGLEAFDQWLPTIRYS